MATYQIDRGNTVEFEMNVITHEDEPMDITGCKIWFTGKTRPEDSDANALWSVNSVDHPTQVAFVNPILGEVLLVLKPENTVNLPTFRKVAFDVQIKDTANKVYTIQKGHFQVNPDVTRTTV